MKLPRLRTILLFPLAIIAALYLVAVFFVATDDRRIEVLNQPPVGNKVIAIFGASGTAGDGILKAAMADPSVQKIHVITRRSTPRMEQGAATGKVEITVHMDYLDYADIRSQMEQTDTVFWALGTSSIGMDEETYARIHVEFPMNFVQTWAAFNYSPKRSFHYISSSDISEESDAMWVRQKIRAEKSLFDFAEGSNLRVIAYRPDYIGPTQEQAQLGQKLIYGFFRPVGAAVKAAEIGRAMLEVNERDSDYANRAKVGTSEIIRLSEAYQRRNASAAVTD